jgi:hypothetical protein
MFQNWTKAEITDRAKEAGIPADRLLIQNGGRGGDLDVYFASAEDRSLLMRLCQDPNFTRGLATPIPT